MKLYVEFTYECLFNLRVWDATLLFEQAVDTIEGDQYTEPVGKTMRLANINKHLKTHQ